ncbi:MAG: hypothetical protein JWP97_4558 [Labilithrix sp.]|nr:hypothetical protein [Labilithrix sp.]
MKTFLVCLDASPRAPLVLSRAVELAVALSAHLVLLRVVGLPPELGHAMYVDTAANLLDSMTADARQDLETVALDHPLARIVACHVHVGAPWDTICREATALEADLVILGSHGYSGFDRFLGTTAAKVVDHCDRSVHVVRPKPAS